MAKRYAWHADRVDPSLASIRYRMLEPLAALKRAGVEIELYDPARGVADYDAIIFCKSHGREAVDIARTARAAARAVIYDNCDNVFSAHRIGHFSADRLTRVREMATLATHLTFSTSVLADQFAVELSGFGKPFAVIPDTLDIEPAAVPAPNPAERRSISRVERFLHRRRDALHLIWFGKSLGNSSGFAHLDRVLRRLATAPDRPPVTVTIVSNSRWNYLKHRIGWRLPCCYAPWRLSTFDTILRLHDVAIIPVETNEYTVGKTINRPATAVLAGLGVIADAIPAYEPLRPFIAMDGMEAGLAHYWQTRGTPDPLVQQGREMLAAEYGADAMARRWLALLERQEA